MSKFHYFRDSEISRNVKFDLNHLKNAGIDDLSIVLQLYYSLEFAVGQVFSDGDLRYHPNASFSAVRYIANLRMIQKLNGVGLRFLDVGCGLGSKVWIAKALGFDAYGLEINPKYVTIANECVGLNRVICVDGITFPSYDQYDVIYFYNPMPTNELETAILKNAKKGTIIYHAIDLQTRPNRSHSRLSARVLRLTGDSDKLRQAFYQKSQFPSKDGAI